MRSPFLWIPLFVLAFVPPLAWGQSAAPGAVLAENTYRERHALFGQLITLHRQAKYEEALPAAERNLQLAKDYDGADHTETVNAILWKAEFYHRLHRHDDADLLYRQALTTHEARFGPDDLSVGLDLYNLARLYHGRGRYAEAEPLYRRSVTIVEARLGRDNGFVAVLLGELARSYQAQGRYPEAVVLYARCRAIRAAPKIESSRW